MGFAHAGRTEKDDVGRLVNEAQSAQFADLALVNRRLKSEFEMIEGLDVGQMRQLQPGLQILTMSRSSTWQRIWRRK